MPPEPRPPTPERPFWTGLSSALAAALLNVGLSCLDQPRAFAQPGAVALALLAALGVFLPVALGLVLGVRVLARAVRLDPESAAGAAASALVLAAALAPPVEVGLRGAAGTRSAVVLLLALGLVGAATVALYLVLARRGGGALRRASIGARAPFLALLLATGLWAEGYRPGGALAVGALGLGLVAGLALWRARTATRARFLSAMTAALLLAGSLGALRGPDRWAPPASSAAVDRPPVVLVTVDTLRSDRVLGAGPARVATPTIDALAADSVVFTHARSAAPWTKPSLATLLTGLSPLVHGMTSRRARLPDEVETLAERLREAGYRTAGIGLNAHLERVFRMNQGFTDYAFPARPDYGLSVGSRLLEALDPARYPELFPSTTSIADVAVDWLDGHAREPFFLWVHFLDPHWPYEPPGEWLAEPHRRPTRWGDPDMVTAVQAGNTKPGQAERERVEELYAGEIRYVDAELGRLMAALRRHGLYDPALIVFASDHGEEFWEHGRYEHGHTLYDEVLRVPLCFKLPGGAEPRLVDAPVTTTAVAPTLLDVLGLDHDRAAFSAGSLRPWWADPAHAALEPSFATGTYYFGEKRGVVFEGTKLVLELDTGRIELFDLDSDPGERHSLTSSRRELVERGLALIEAEEQRGAALRERLGLRGEYQAAGGEDVERMLQSLGYAGGEDQGHL